MIDILDQLGYHVFEPKVLKAIHHKVPQKRERLFIIGVKKMYRHQAELYWPTPSKTIYTLKDALLKGTLYDSDVPSSPGQQYPQKKKEILKHIPPGGYWRDLPVELQKEYMQKSYYLGGGKTGIARRISWEEPCLTLTCSPAQKQTERCHPDEIRPFSVREYARIQTFPDNWEYEGSITHQYRQIGNAVPVNLAHAVGLSVTNLLKSIENVSL